MPSAGEKIGPYTLIRELGVGSFGIVWLGEKRTRLAAHRIALKIAREDWIDLVEIEREADLWEKASSHPNVLPIFDADVYDDQIVVIASQYAPDGSLGEWLVRHGGKAPSVDRAVEIAHGILAGLEHLHSLDIIHRDLKPANILLQGDTPRIADFGLARLLKSDTHSMRQSGTFPYMAPEAFDGDRSAQTDIWSAGVVFYQLLAGRLPFPQTDIVSLVGAITRYEPELDFLSGYDSLQKVIYRSLQKNPAERYKSAAEMRIDLRNAWRALPSSNADESSPGAPQPISKDAEPLLRTVRAPVPGFDSTLKVWPPLPAASPEVDPAEPKQKQSDLSRRNRGWWVAGVLSFLVFILLMSAGIRKAYLYSLDLKAQQVAARRAKQAHQHADQGKIFQDRSEFGKAEAEFRIAIQLDPNQADLHVNLASMLATLNKEQEAKSEYKEAERLARESLRAEPGKAANHHDLGSALSGLRDDTAEAEFREAIRLNSNQGLYHESLSLLLLRNDRGAEAEVEAREAIRLDPNESRHQVSLGAILFQQDKYVEAEAVLRRAMQLNPNSTRTHRILGNSLSGQGKFDQAEAECREATRLHPDNEWAHACLARNLRLQKKYSEAEFEYREAVRAGPNQFQHRVNLAIFLTGQNRNVEARTEFESAETGYKEAIRLEPTQPNHYNNLGDFLNDRRRYVEAERPLREAIRINPQNASYHQNLAVSLQNQNKYTDAEASFREAIRLNPAATSYRDKLATLLSNQKKYVEAEAEYAQAIRLYPQEPVYRGNFAIFLLDRKRYSEAETTCREAVRLNPNHSNYHSNLGVALYHQKDYPAAEEEFRVAIRLQPQHAQYHENLAAVLKKQSRDAESKTAFDEAKRLRKK